MLFQIVTPFSIFQRIYTLISVTSPECRNKVYCCCSFRVVAVFFGIIGPGTSLRRFSYSQYGTGTSVQPRLMQGEVFSSPNGIDLFSKILSRMNLHCEIIPLQCWEHKCVPAIRSTYFEEWVAFVAININISSRFAEINP